MIEITDEQFEALISKVLDDLKEESVQSMDNVAIVWADNPTLEQLQKQHVPPNQLLLGLYEGIPLNRRLGSYNAVLPDKITIFKQPLLLISNSSEDLSDRVKSTVLHEIAHHFGIDHPRIHELEENRQKKRLDQ